MLKWQRKALQLRTPYYGNAQKRHGFGVGSTIHYYDEASWGLEKESLPTIVDWRPEHEDYKSWQLDRFADRILWESIDAGHKSGQYPAVLMFEHIKERRKKEIYVASGIPDETVTHDLSPDGQTMYWRTHPKGRTVNDEELRKRSGSSFYR